jgi:DNA-binding transcriptional MerR regulator
VADRQELGIGEFALVTGLSVPRLRRYHDLGLLVPAHVDAQTGYRSYGIDQVPNGRRIRRLRQTALPLEDLGRIVAGGENAAGVLRRHRRRLLEQIATTNQMIDLVDQLIREERSMTTSLQLVEVILRVEDVDATMAFYRDVLGMEFQADDHNGALPLHYDACGGSWEPEGFFMFTIYPADGQPTKTNVGFGVPDLDETWRRAQAHNATEIAPPTDSGYMPRQAIFEDNAGNRVNVYHRGGDW